MKLQLSIFILILSSVTALCQASKVDSLKGILVLLESDRARIDKEIKKINAQISQILIDEFKNDSRILSIRSTGGHLMSGPSYLASFIIKIPKGDIVHISNGYYNDGYLKASYQNKEGYIPIAVLEQTPELKALVKNGSNIEAQEKSTQQNNLIGPGGGSSPVQKNQSRTYYKGPKGGCYYINSNGNKTYVDRSFCN